MKNGDCVYCNIELVADLMSVSKQTVVDWLQSGKLVCNNRDERGNELFTWEELSQLSPVKEMQEGKWDEQHSIKPLRPYRSIELFAGAGGLALGLEKAGFKHVLLNEMVSDACNTLRRNRPEWNVVEGDVSKLDFTQAHDIDLVSGGFPCQAFSYVGQRAGFEDARGTLFFEWARVIKETRPRMILGENVRGLLSHDNGKTIDVIKNVIRDLGYTLMEPKVLKAIFYQVPQKRERLALVGVRNDLLPYFNFTWPDKANRVYTVRDAFKKGELYKCDVPKSEGQKYQKRKAEIMSMVPPGGYWRDLPDAVQREYMKASYFLGGGKTGMARRLSWDAPSLTLTCAPAQNQTERCHPEESRPLTIREYARLQTFPDDWEFVGNVASQYRQIGNAVPVNLAEALGHMLVDALNGIESACPHLSSQDEVDKPTEIRATTTVLVGTFRPENKSWIASRKLYNLPLVETTKAAEYNRFTHIALYGEDAAPMAFAASYKKIVDIKWLEEHGYSVSKCPRSDKYALFDLGDNVPITSVLANPAADVYVCSTEYVGKITSDFYNRQFPQCKGKSTVMLFSKIKSYFRKCRSAFAFNPVQLNLFERFATNVNGVVK